MSRKFISEQSLVTDRWISFDPLDDEIILKLFKKDIREGEERLMLAVLADAIDDFKKYAFSKDQRGQKLFQEAEEWFLEKDDESFSPLNISVRLCNCTPATYVEGCSPGNNQSSRRILLRVLVKAARS